jgi:hypothetical protein
MELMEQADREQSAPNRRAAHDLFTSHLRWSGPAIGRTDWTRKACHERRAGNVRGITWELNDNVPGYLVTWTDQRATGGVYAARLDVAGHLLDPVGTLPIPVNHFGETTSLVANGSTLLLAYDRIADENNYGGVSRVFTQLTSPLLLPHQRAVAH